MKKALALILLTVGITSCATMDTGSSRDPLYGWNNYETTSYDYYKKKTPEATQALIKTYETMIKKSSGSRKAVPPGIHAEYGYFLIASGKQEEGVALLKKEKELYPESSVFMDRLIKQFTK